MRFRLTQNPCLFQYQQILSFVFYLAQTRANIFTNIYVVQLIQNHLASFLLGVLLLPRLPFHLIGFAFSTVHLSLSA